MLLTIKTNKKNIEEKLDERIDSLINQWNINIEGKENENNLVEFENEIIEINGKTFRIKNWHHINSYLKKIDSRSIFMYQSGIFYGRVKGKNRLKNYYLLENIKATEGWKELRMIRINDIKYLPINTFEKFLFNFFYEVYKKKSDNKNARKAQETIKELLKEHYDISEFKDRKSENFREEVIDLTDFHEDGHGNYEDKFKNFGKLIYIWDNFHNCLSELGADWVDHKKFSKYGFIRDISKKDKERAKKYLALDISLELYPILKKPEMCGWEDWVVSNIERPLVLNAYNSEDISDQLAKGQKYIEKYILNKLNMSKAEEYDVRRSKLFFNEMLREANEFYKKSFEKL